MSKKKKKQSRKHQITPSKKKLYLLLTYKLYIIAFTNKLSKIIALTFSLPHL